VRAVTKPHRGARPAGDDLRAFTCAIAGAIALTPVVWVHDVVLLLEPLGLSDPRLNGNGLQPFVLAAIAALLLWAMLARPRGVGLPAEGRP
jgi:hypothetical protein